MTGILIFMVRDCIWLCSASCLWLGFGRALFIAKPEVSRFCMTYNESTNETVVRRCPYNSRKTVYEEFYVKLTQNISHLNEFMCGGLNRTGPLCSHCMHGGYGDSCVLLYVTLFTMFGEFEWVVVVRIPCRLPHNNVLPRCNNVSSTRYCSTNECFHLLLSIYLYHYKYITICSLECIIIYPLCNNYCNSNCLWILEFGLLSLCHSFLLCKWSAIPYSGGGPGVCCSILSLAYDCCYLYLCWIAR